MFGALMKSGDSLNGIRSQFAFMSTVQLAIKTILRPPRRSPSRVESRVDPKLKIITCLLSKVLVDAKILHENASRLLTVKLPFLT